MDGRKAFDGGCRPRSAMVAASRPPHARQWVTGPAILPLSLPELPWRRARVPQRVQMLLVAQRIHGLPKAAMHPGRELPARCEILHRLLLPDGLRPVDQLEHARLEHEEAAV